MYVANKRTCATILGQIPYYNLTDVVVYNGMYLLLIFFLGLSVYENAKAYLPFCWQTSFLHLDWDGRLLNTIKHTSNSTWNVFAYWYLTVKQLP